MQIPQITVVLTQAGREYPLRGSLDTGYDGLAVVRPDLARRLNLPVVGSQRLVGFGGENTVSIGRMDALTIKGSPACSLKNVQVAITEIPGTDDILLGEEFFKKFQFDINYREGEPLVIACTQRVPTLGSSISDFFEPWLKSPFFIPSLFAGGLAIWGLASLLMPDEPRQQRTE